MREKIFNLYAYSLTILLIYLFGHIHISNASQNCQYSQGNRLPLANIWCPGICCSNIATSANTTCCTPPPITVTTSTFTIFGYSWWRLFLVVIFLFVAISILFHYTKRVHVLKHFKNFNSVVDPAAAFTISKSSLDLKLNETGVTLEENPPSYTHVASPSPPPPPYTSVNLEK